MSTQIEIFMTEHLNSSGERCSTFLLLTLSACILKVPSLVGGSGMECSDKLLRSLKNVPKKQRILVTNLVVNITLSGMIRLLTSQKLNWIECSEAVCFWTHFHRVILINKTSKDENETNIDIETEPELYLKSLKKNVVLIHQNKAEIGE